MEKLEDALGPLEVPQPVLAQIVEGRAGGEDVVHELLGRQREQNLAAVGRRTETRTAVYRRAVVIAVPGAGLAGVERHPNTQRRVSRPGLGHERLLEGRRG